MQSQAELKSNVKFINENFENCYNIESIILKGHLLTEHFINKLIEKSTLNGIKFNPSYFTYKQKIEIIRFISYKLPKEIIIFLTTLNNIRNKISHNLTFDISMIKSFIGDVNDKIIKDKNLKKESTEVSLRLVITYICGMIDASIKAYSSLNHHLINQIEKNK
jgi:hypothetical protein